MWFGWFGWFFLVHIWFIYGSYMVHIWFIYVSYMVHIWFVYGSYMVHIWFIYGSYMVHIWFIYGSYVHNIWFMDVMVVTDNRWPMGAPMTSLGTTGKHREAPRPAGPWHDQSSLWARPNDPAMGSRASLPRKNAGTLTNSLLILLVLNVGNGWEWMGCWGNGMIITSDYGSFPENSLLSTSKTDTHNRI